MKIKFFSLIAGTFAAALAFTSCLKNDVEEVTLSSESSIVSFSIGTLYTHPLVGKDKQGNDSIYRDSVDCSVYPFTIDQINRIIENEDSLPVNMDVTKVLANLTADTEYIIYQKNGKDTLWTAADSIDFTEPVIFKVLAYSGVKGKPYTVKVNVHKQYPDSLIWKDDFTNTFNGTVLHKQKAVYANGTVYVFGEDSNGQPKVFYAAVKTEGDRKGFLDDWKEKPLSFVSGEIDSYSAVACGGQVYFLAGTNLYSLENEEQITSNCQRIIAGVEGLNFLYAIRTDRQSGKFSLEQKNWEDMSAADAVTWPSQRISAISYSSDYNKELVHTIAMVNGGNGGNGHALIYDRTSGDTSWEECEQKSLYACPDMENISMIYYDEALYAFGGGLNEKLRPFEAFYRSEDNGLTWNKVINDMSFPESFGTEYYKSDEGSYSCVVDENNYIWMIWEDGHVSRGRINRLQNP